MDIKEENIANNNCDSHQLANNDYLKIATIDDSLIKEEQNVFPLFVYHENLSISLLNVVSTINMWIAQNPDKKLTNLVIENFEEIRHQGGDIILSFDSEKAMSASIFFQDHKKNTKLRMKRRNTREKNRK